MIFITPRVFLIKSITAGVSFPRTVSPFTCTRHKNPKMNVFVHLLIKKFLLDVISSGVYSTYHNDFIPNSKTTIFGCHAVGIDCADMTDSIGSTLKTESQSRTPTFAHLYGENLGSMKNFRNYKQGGTKIAILKSITISNICSTELFS